MLRIDGVVDALPVASLRGHEDVNALYVFELVVAAQEASGALEETALNRLARLTIESYQQPRLVYGIVQSARLVSRHNGWAGDVYRVTVVPKLWRLRPTRNSRIFQELTVPQIVDAILDMHAIERKWATVRRPLPKEDDDSRAVAFQPRAYCVQYRESDLDFVKRLLSEEGLFFSFGHPADGQNEVMVISDDASRYPPIEGTSKIPFRDDTMAASEDAISSFDWGGQVLTGQTFVKEYDFERPKLALNAVAIAADTVDANETSWEVYDHSGRFAGEHVDTTDAELLLEQLRSERRTGRGTSWCPRLQAGRTFELCEAATTRLNRGYVVTSVSHEGSDPRYGDSDDTSRRYYNNSFTCIPATTPCRPPRISWHVQQTFETATVVGPAGAEIYTDPHGRVKVQFHWDRQGKQDEFSSCWMRVMQPWAGAGWGHQFIPRIGMEVLVLLLGGDADNPVVVGSAYNGENRAPFTLEEHKTRSGLRTSTTPGGNGFNELSFQDLAGHEEVYVHAQRDLRERVLNDHRTLVKNDQVNDVSGRQIEIVGGDQTLSVRGNRSETVDLNMRREVLGDETVTIDGDAKRVIEGWRRDRIDGDERVKVGGSYRRRVARAIRLEAGEDLTIATAASMVTRVGGASVTRIAASEHHHVVGDSVTIRTGPHIVNAATTTALFDGTVVATVTDKLLLHVAEGLTLKCGESSIEIGKDTIRLTAPNVDITGSDELSCHGGESAMVRLDGDCTAIGETVNVKSEGAAVTLTDKAKIEGSKISLGSGSGDKAKKETEGEQTESEPLEFVAELFDASANEPLANEPFVARGHAPTPFEGVTDGAGLVKIPLLYERCTIYIDVGEHRLEFRVGQLAPADTRRGMIERLAGLGFGPSDPDMWCRDDFFEQVNHFERLHGLDESDFEEGDISDQTADALSGEFGR